MPPDPAAHEVSRRSLLRAGVVGLTLSGCGVDLSRLRDVRLDDDEPVVTPTAGPDEVARRTAVGDADLLRRAASAAAAGAAAPVAAVLASVVADHTAHLEALGAADLAVETPTTAAAPTATPAPQLPALPQLPAAESTAAFAALAVLDAVSGPMARLLASVAAADAVHARLLAGAAGVTPPAVPSPVTDVTRQTWSADVDDEAAAALAAALEGEHAAVFGYGVVAARLADAAREQAVEHLAAHEDVVQRLTEVLRGADRDVPVAAPAYDLPAVTTEAEVRGLATALEERTAALHAACVAATVDGARLLAADLLVGAALRGAAWRGAAVPLPGLPAG